MLPGRGTAGCCAVMLYVGEGLRGSNGARSPLHQISVFHSATHNQTGPLWCWFPSGWACAHSRPLWVSPMTSPVRLGVSPAAAPTPTGVFNQRFEALFPPVLEPWVARFASLPTVCPVYLCANVGPWGLLPTARPAPFSATLSLALLAYLRECGAEVLPVVRLPAPLIPHSASLSPATVTQVLSAPAACLCPSYRSG